MKYVILFALYAGLVCIRDVQAMLYLVAVGDLGPGSAITTLIDALPR